MGLFKKEETKQDNSRPKTALFNMDGTGYFSVISKTFIGKFDDEQKKELQYAMERDFPLKAYAYEELPANYMHCINQVLESSFQNPPAAVDIWKVVNSGLAYPQFEEVMWATASGFKLVDEIPYIRLYDKELLATLCTVQRRTGKDLCKMITPDMDRESFMRKCKKIIAKQDKLLGNAIEMEKYSG